MLHVATLVGALAHASATVSHVHFVMITFVAVLALLVTTRGA